MQPPKGVEVFEGEIGRYWFGDDGILHSISNNKKRTVENVTHNVALVKKITNGKKMPLLVYLCKSPVPDQATRSLVSRELPNIYTAMAMISTSGLDKIIMNFLFKLKPPPIPMKSFSDDEAGREWLQQFIPVE
jgi:hypothetical protein